MGARAVAAQLADGDTPPWVKDALCRAQMRTFTGDMATQAEQRVYEQCVHRLYPDRKAVGDLLAGTLLLIATIAFAVAILHLLRRR